MVVGGEDDQRVGAGDVVEEAPERRVDAPELGADFVGADAVRVRERVELEQ